MDGISCLHVSSVCLTPWLYGRKTVIGRKTVGHHLEDVKSTIPVREPGYVR